MTHFGANKHAMALNSSEKCLEHTRAMGSHFWSNEQTTAIKSSEKCYKSATPQHTRALSTHFRAREQSKPPRSSEKYLQHTRAVNRISKLRNRQWHSKDQKTAQGTLV
jgi:hypothetical protein